MVDKNLFLYDFAVVAIMKDEEPYVKEWLDYHLLAGVDHFYIYDNGSTPEFKKILQPYIDAEIVTYIFYPGKFRQIEAYNDAILRFRFFCRYMIFIDGDEFIFPKIKSPIAELADCFIKDDLEVVGIALQWMLYGSNGQIKADYSRGVLEKFTRRSSTVNESIKTVINPRRVNYFWTAHFPKGFYGCDNICADSSRSVVINHYHTKSREEYTLKENRGSSVYQKDVYYTDSMFDAHDKNDVYDDSILKYRDERKALLTPSGDITEIFPSKSINYSRIFEALAKNLLPVTDANTPQSFFENNLENFMICRKVSLHLQKIFPDKEDIKLFEDAALESLLKSIKSISYIPIVEAQLLLSELPELLTINPADAKQIRDVCIQIIKYLIKFFNDGVAVSHNTNLWKDFANWSYNLRILESLKISDKRS